MKSQKSFRFNEDAGHGWLSVPVKYLVQLGLLDKISSCSYIKGQTAYLEEDCDASVFIEAFIAANGKDSYSIVKSEWKEYSPIRYYPHYTIFRAEAAYEKLMKKHL